MVHAPSPYQVRAIDRMDARSREGFGHALFDDQGVGKTIEMLALLAREHERDPSFRYVLVVPKSTIEAWENEARHCVYEPMHGAVQKLLCVRDARHRQMQPHKWLLVTTPTIVLCAHKKYPNGLLHSQKWRGAVADEAHLLFVSAATQGRGKSQRIRATPARKCKTATAALAMQYERGWALTGTPILNRLSDLAGIARFVLQPTGDRLREPEAWNTPSVRENLELFAGEHMTRRSLADVLDLDPPEELVVDCPMSPLQIRCANAGLFRAMELLESQVDELHGAFGGGIKQQPGPVGAAEQGPNGCGVDDRLRGDEHAIHVKQHVRGHDRIS